MNPLNIAWGRINALGGTVTEYDDFGRGCNHAVGQALDIIEELGGKDPLSPQSETELEQLKRRLDSRLNDVLCEMREGYDDSIVGFNEAWDVMRKLFDEMKKARES